LSTSGHSKHVIIRWATLKGIAAILLFLAIAALMEYLVILYAINLGVRDATLIQWNIQIPGTDWIATITVSPLFHLVPIAVIICLAFTWVYLTKYAALKPMEIVKGKGGFASKREKEAKIKSFSERVKSGLLKVKGVAYLWQKIYSARATIKSALTVFLAFATLILIFSLFAYPKLIYETVTRAYQNNPSLLGFMKSVAEFFAPIGSAFSVINNVLLSIAPSFRNIVLTLGVIIKPLADLDNVGKYLVFQNLAVWISAFAALFYGEIIRKSYRRKKFRS